jgi:thiol-disulfide isomerase/thioredoxin
MVKKHPTHGAHVPGFTRHCFFLSLLCALCAAPGWRAAQGPAAPAGAPPATPLSSGAQESEALQEAVRSSADNPQALIKNLEEFLRRFPQSARREQVLEAIYESARRGNDSQTAIEYGGELLKLRPNDAGLLSSLVELLDRQENALGRAQALEYTTNFVQRAEKELQESARSAGGKEKVPESATVKLAAAYLIRGKLYAGSAQPALAQADYEKSYVLYPSRRGAELLGDLAAAGNDFKRALDQYVTAFAFPGVDPAPAHKEEIRRKLGSCYRALHPSEEGLGDLVLVRYDALVREMAGRFQEARPQPGADPHDPFAYVLERPNGPPLRLADYRGKVLVMEFWATWCGACRLEGKLVERVAENFRNEPGVQFLAVNVDEDHTAVPAFLKAEQWTTTVAYSQGLERPLAVQSLPTLVIFDRRGLVVYRLEGLEPGSFMEALDKKVREVLRQPEAGSPPG